jgi:PPE-repeat protein
MVLAVLFLFLYTGEAPAEIYSYTDNKGELYFVDGISKVPAPKQLENVRPLRDIYAAGTEKGPDQNVGGEKAGTPQAGDLKARMMNDEGIMELILSMQNDPDMQTILSDPSAMQAVQAGDTGGLMNNPVFLKFINNPRVREIVEKMNASGAGAR